MSDPVDPQIPVRRQAVPVRDPRYSPRGPGSRVQASHVLVIVLFCIFVVGAASFVVMALGATSASPSPGPSGSQIAVAPGSVQGSLAPGQTPGPTVPAATDTPGPGETPATPGPDGTPDPTQTPGPVADVVMPLVPVISFWATDDSISMKELTRAFQGQSSTYPKVIVEPGDRDAIAAALNITLADSVENGDVEQIRQKTRDGYLGLIPASDLTPQLRALSIGSASLVGEDHLSKLSNWPLMATVKRPVAEKWDAGATWTIVAGGDMFLDRGVENTTLHKGGGVDYPFQGGTARVTGHCACSPSQQIPGELVPTSVRTGNKGIVRAFVQNADLAIANLENPIPDHPSWHLSGTVFGGPPKLLGMFTYAGIDWVSLANNHILDYGADGIAQTRANLKKVGIPFTGAGKNAAQAGEISYLKANGLKVAMVACVGVVPGVFAGQNKAGGLPCKDKYVVPAIQEARQNADVVIVFAHWGNEYHREPFPSQEPLAKDWVDAGADLVLGAHPHVYGGLQEVDGHTVIYSMGNFIFDQYWSTATMEGALTELTFQGTKLVQVRLHPMIMLDQSQPNFLNPATDDGKELLKEIRAVADPMGW